MRRFFSLTQKLLTFFTSALMTILLLVLTWQVVSRYIFNDPSTVTEELGRLLLICMATTGAVLSFYKRKHLALDLIHQKCSPATKAKLADISAVATMTLGFLLLVGGIFMIQQKWSLGQKSAVLGFKLVYLYFLVPLCGALIMLSPFHQGDET